MCCLRAMIALFFRKVDCIWSGPRCRQVAARLFGGGFFWRSCRLPLVPPIHAAPWRAVRHWLLHQHFKKKVAFIFHRICFWRSGYVVRVSIYVRRQSAHFVPFVTQSPDLEQLGSRRLVQSSRKLKSEMRRLIRSRWTWGTLYPMNIHKTSH